MESPRRGPVLFGLALVAALTALGAVVAVQQRAIWELQSEVADLRHRATAIPSARRAPPVAPVAKPPVSVPIPAPAPPPAKGLLARLADLPAEISSSRLWEGQANPSDQLIRELNLTGQAAEEFRALMDREVSSWVRWIDAERAAGGVDEREYGAFLADLMGRTDAAVDDLLNEAQTAVYGRWRGRGFEPPPNE